MPVTKVSFHLPRDFEAASVTVRDGVVEVVPLASGRNAYAAVGHVVVETDDGGKQTGRVEVNSTSGEVRIVRFALPGAKEAVRPPPPPPPGGAAAGPLPARPDVAAAARQPTPAPAPGPAPAPAPPAGKVNGGKS